MAKQKSSRRRERRPDEIRAMSGKERQTIIPENYPVGGWKNFPADPRDLRPDETPKGKPWFLEPKKYALKTKSSSGFGKRGGGGKSTVANPYASIAARDFLEKYYGGDLLNQINAATEAEKQNRALVGDRRQRATDIVPVYRDKELSASARIGGGVPSGRYFSGQFSDRSTPTAKRKLHIELPSRVKKGQDITWEHEAGHHLNLFTPEYYRKISPNLPERGRKIGGIAAHAFNQPQELAEAIGRMQRQWYAHTKANPEEYPEGARRMSDKDFDRLMNSKYLPKGFKLLKGVDRGHAGHFIEALKQWKKEDPKKGKALIDQIRKVKDSFVDTGGSKFFPTENIA